MARPAVAIACCRRTPDAAPGDLYPDRDAGPLQRALAERGCDNTLAAWDDPDVDWATFGRVVVSRTWDSVDRPAEFTAWAETVSSHTALVNPAPLLRWGLDKGHQRDLAAAGIPVIPTCWVPPGGDWEPPTSEYVIKPAVSGGARSTARYRPGDTTAAQAHVASLHADGQTVMVQPYVASTDHHGEVNPVYLNGRYRHAVSKRPALPAGRGMVKRPWERTAWSGPVNPSIEELAVADATVAHIETLAGAPPVYARVDLVDGSGGPLLLEVEVVDPYLGLDLFPDAAFALASAIVEA